MSSSMGRIIPNIWKIKKCLKPPSSSSYEVFSTPKNPPPAPSFAMLLGCLHFRLIDGPRESNRAFSQRVSQGRPNLHELLKIHLPPCLLLHNDGQKLSCYTLTAVGCWTAGAFFQGAMVKFFIIDDHCPISGW